MGKLDKKAKEKSFNCENYSESVRLGYLKTGGCYPARAGWGFLHWSPFGKIPPPELLSKPQETLFEAFYLLTMKRYFLYILFSEKIDQYYIGISQDPHTRLHFHNTSNKGWTRRGRP